MYIYFICSSKILSLEKKGPVFKLLMSNWIFGSSIIFFPPESDTCNREIPTAKLRQEVCQLAGRTAPLPNLPMTRLSPGLERVAEDSRPAVYLPPGHIWPNLREADGYF